MNVVPDRAAAHRHAASRIIACGGYNLGTRRWEAARGEAGMDEEDLLPQRQKPKLRDLTLMGVAELEEYIAEMRTEIARVEAEIAEKRKHRGGAEALFRR
jgi:uncharacterized small protein (DUF1192 family)